MRHITGPQLDLNLRHYGLQLRPLGYQDSPVCSYTSGTLSVPPPSLMWAQYVRCNTLTRRRNCLIWGQMCNQLKIVIVSFIYYYIRYSNRSVASGCWMIGDKISTVKTVSEKKHLRPSCASHRQTSRSVNIINNIVWTKCSQKLTLACLGK